MSISPIAPGVSVSLIPIAASAWNHSRRRFMAEEIGTSPDEVQFRFRDGEPVDHAAVTVDSFLDQSNAAAVRIEPGDDARDLLPYLDRLALVEEIGRASCRERVCQYV